MAVGTAREIVGSRARDRAITECMVGEGVRLTQEELWKMLLKGEVAGTELLMDNVERVFF